MSNFEVVKDKNNDNKVKLRDIFYIELDNYFYDTKDYYMLCSISDYEYAFISLQNGTMLQSISTDEAITKYSPDEVITMLKEGMSIPIDISYFGQCKIMLKL